MWSDNNNIHHNIKYTFILLCCLYDDHVTMIAMIEAAARIPRQRSTTYGNVSSERQRASLQVAELDDIENTPARKYERTERRELVRPGLRA